VSTADLAVIGMALVSLASIGRDFKLHMKVADRLRLVNPPTPQVRVKVIDEAKPDVAVESIAAARKAGAA
jgi:hypothetical protein